MTDDPKTQMEKANDKRTWAKVVAVAIVAIVGVVAYIVSGGKTKPPTGA